ncbi:GNAT family N-acetyltransferase [Bacillus mesophilum]|uniref:GNAT family N-acetyltransferase n=1 Tax=Bacillus mesophilum TaxID=1071718 RepID=A0A7V7RJ53_9BACI|nr:GNAT family N-acetyltransferase [Bacillus mesophilum]KAB2330686.1 GNAT family N-acetyltransferase [Bacillus mesophilum]
MIQKIDITDPEHAKAVLDVQILSYNIEADIIGYQDIPPLKDTVEALQQCGEIFFGYYCGEKLCGVISFKLEKNILDIHRLIVHPQYFRKGIAGDLLSFIEIYMENIDAICVSTASKNVPAVQFYIKSGFSRLEEIRVNEQLSLTSFKKKLQ